MDYLTGFKIPDVYNEYKSGLRTDPCGTPARINFSFERASPTCTLKVLLSRYERISFTWLTGINSESILTNFLQETLSKVCALSRKVETQYSPFYKESSINFKILCNCSIVACLDRNPNCSSGSKCLRLITFRMRGM